MYTASYRTLYLCIPTIYIVHYHTAFHQHLQYSHCTSVYLQYTCTVYSLPIIILNRKWIHCTCKMYTVLIWVRMDAKYYWKAVQYRIVFHIIWPNMNLLTIGTNLLLFVLVYLRLPDISWGESRRSSCEQETPSCDQTLGDHRFVIHIKFDGIKSSGNFSFGDIFRNPTQLTHCHGGILTGACTIHDKLPRECLNLGRLQWPVERSHFCTEFSQHG